jgi:ATP-binding cassette subfamily B multidrug efflux pump
MRRMLGFLEPYRRDSLLALLLVVAMTAADLMTPRLVQQIIDQGIAQQNLAVVIRTTLLMLGVGLVSAVLTVANSVLSVRVFSHFGADLRSELYRKIQSLSFGNLDHLQTGELMVRLSSDVNQVQQVVLMSLRILARAPLLLVGSFALMIITSPGLALVMLALVPITVGMIGIIAARGRSLFATVQRKLDRLNTILQENLAGVRVVKAFVRADFENKRFEAANRDLMGQTMQVMQLFSVVIPTLLLFVNLALVAVMWFGGERVAAGNLTTGEVVAFTNYLLTSVFPLLMMGGMVAILAAAQASANRIQQVLDSPPDVQDRPGAQQLTDVAGRLAFEDVCFSYSPECQEPVLSNINLTAQPGQTVAILGATGSGKSTLINLIPRFYDVTEGRVTIDGIDVRDVTLDSLRKHIGVALQDPILFSGSIRENIAYGNPDATDGEVIAAAKAAQAHDFVQTFPEGYDTQVGQRGVNLSGGQKQRIAIARALLTRPSILILDDSTSSVDVATEAKIETALEELRDGCTTFVIAQRVSTVLNADKIVVMDRGRVVAVGPHMELLQSSPVYQEIYESQLGDGEGAND